MVNLPSRDIPTFPKVGDVFLTTAGTIYTILADNEWAYRIRFEAAPGIAAEFSVAARDIITDQNVPLHDWVEFQKTIRWHLTNIRDVLSHLQELDISVKMMSSENMHHSLLDVPLWATAHSSRANEFVFYAGMTSEVLNLETEPILMFDMSEMKKVFREEGWENLFSQENEIHIFLSYEKMFHLRKQLISYRNHGINPFKLIEGKDDEVSF